MKTLGNVPSLQPVNVSGMPWKVPESCSQVSVITDIQKTGYDSGLFHLGIETVFHSGIGLWVQAVPFKFDLVMYVCWELNRKEELAQFLECQGPFPEGSIQTTMVLNRDCWKLCSFVEISIPSFWKNLGVGIDWFTLLPLNGERTGNDVITVQERKQGEGGGTEWWRSGDTPFQTGVRYSLFLLWLLPKKVAAHFPHNKACVVSYLLTPKAYFAKFYSSEEEERRRKWRRKQEDK